MRLLSEGDLIRDTYEVERFLGEGAFAEVYRVRHRYLGRQAMKVFKRVGMSFDEIQDVLGEAILLTRIGHPNIIRVFDANVHETNRGRCGYFTMEHIPGGSLHKFWQSHGPRFVPVETTVELIRQVCRGIALAHREKPPIIHRDIKPQNILVGYEADGLRARVSDFGLAKNVNPLTLLATAAGTLAFKPPEAFMSRQSDSCAGDVWAIGTTLYLLLTDRLPYDLPANVTWEQNNYFDKPLTLPSDVNPDVNSGLDKIILAALGKQTADRFPTAVEILSALERWKPTSSSGVSASEFISGEGSKTVLGPPTPVDEKAASALVDRAFKIKATGRLSEAADILEEAFNKHPVLREKFSGQVKLWRCGISM